MSTEIELGLAKVRVLVSSRETRGRYAICRIDAAPGAVPVHSHCYEDVWFYVVDGEFRFVIAGKEERTAPGTSVFIPRETVYSIIGAGQLLLIGYPGGLDLLLDDVAANIGNSMASILEKHGISGVSGVSSSGSDRVAE